VPIGPSHAEVVPVGLLQVGILQDTGGFVEGDTPTPVLVPNNSASRADGRGERTQSCGPHSKIDLAHIAHLRD
jgi:hypothetical protein